MVCGFQLVSSLAGGKAKRRRLVCIVNAHYVKEAALRSYIFSFYEPQLDHSSPPLQMHSLTLKSFPVSTISMKMSICFLYLCHTEH